MTEMTDVEQSMLIQKAAHSDEMREQADIVGERLQAWELAKKVATERKNEYDEELQRLLAMARQETPKVDPQGRLPIGQVDSEDVDSPISILQGVSEAILSKLKAQNIERMPQLGALVRGEDERFPDGPKQVPGVGPHAADLLIQGYNNFRHGDATAPRSMENIEAPKELEVRKSRGRKKKEESTKEDKSVSEQATTTTEAEEPKPKTKAQQAKVRVKKLVDGMDAAVGDELNGKIFEDGTFVCSAGCFNADEYERIAT